MTAWGSWTGYLRGCRYKYNQISCLSFVLRNGAVFCSQVEIQMENPVALEACGDGFVGKPTRPLHKGHVPVVRSSS